jgi:hypothetical protein
MIKKNFLEQQMARKVLGSSTNAYSPKITLLQDFAMAMLQSLASSLISAMIICVGNGWCRKISYFSLSNQWVQNTQWILCTPEPKLGDP